MRTSQIPLERFPYRKLAELWPEPQQGMRPDDRPSGKSLLKSMRDYQGFWKPVDLRKRRQSP